MIEALNCDFSRPAIDLLRTNDAISIEFNPSPLSADDSAVPIKTCGSQLVGEGVSRIQQIAHFCVDCGDGMGKARSVVPPTVKYTPPRGETDANWWF
ncbi:MAG UNVERIFIED_CONTAM: hypothetical protein LVT10_03865 [Anaerolineae bacterium]